MAFIKAFCVWVMCIKPRAMTAASNGLMFCALKNLGSNSTATDRLWNCKHLRKQPTVACSPKKATYN